MKRLFSPFILTISAILAAAYLYVAWRLAEGPAAKLLLALPFLLVWVVPVVYWGGGDREHSPWDDVVHAAGYLSMGWVNFLVLLTLLRDLVLGLTAGLEVAPGLHGLLAEQGGAVVFPAAFAALGLGVLGALGGPRVRRVRIPVAGLAPGLRGLRIVQISDLHVGAFIGPRYVRRVVRRANGLAPDLVALTGDIVDGPVERLAPLVAPLGELAPRRGSFLVLGNHDYYSGAAAWTRQFRSLGLQVLLNESTLVEKDGARLVVGGVLDPAVGLFDRSQSPRPDLAAAPEAGPAFRLLLAHHPKLAPAAEAAGFDLQLSGHTHAGQFFPWTLVVKMVHSPHVAGLSRQGKLWVYVSAGTGSWGPPVRFGTRTELTLLELVPA